MEAVFHHTLLPTVIIQSQTKAEKTYLQKVLGEQPIFAIMAPTTTSRHSPQHSRIRGWVVLQGFCKLLLTHNTQRFLSRLHITNQLIEMRHLETFLNQSSAKWLYLGNSPIMPTACPTISDLHRLMQRRRRSDNIGRETDAPIILR